jgi:hypothetical protein
MNEMQSAATAMHASGLFSDIKSQAQAMVKVMAGAEIGLPPFAAMTGIHIVQGKPVLGANLIATLVKNDPRYDYRVKRADNEACVLVWYESGHVVGESGFTLEEAKVAGLTGKDNWRKYTSDMLFARAISRGARRYAPGIFGGAPVYTPDEMGVDTDEDGHIVPGVVVDATPAAPAPARNNGKANAEEGEVTEVQPQPEPDTGPLTDDELVIKESHSRAFIQTAAGLLGTDEGAIKTRLRDLGYKAIPGKLPDRLNAYRKLKAATAEDDTDTDGDADTDAAQDELFPATAGQGAYTE